MTTSTLEPPEATGSECETIADLIEFVRGQMDAAEMHASKGRAENARLALDDAVYEIEEWRRSQS